MDNTTSTAPETASPPTPDPRIDQFLDTAQQLQQQAADLQPPKYPGMTAGQALVGIAGALATSSNPHAQFVAGFMPALGQAVDRQYGNSEQGWQVARQNLLDQAGMYAKRAAGLQQWQEDVYKAQMGLYGQQQRGVGAAQVRANADGTPPSATPAPDPQTGVKTILQQRGIPNDAVANYLPMVSRMPDSDAAQWVGSQASADALIKQAGQVARPAPGNPFDLGSALFTIRSIGTAADNIRAQLPNLRATRSVLAAQLATGSATGAQAAIAQYDRAVQASGAQLDRLAGASKQISDAIAQRSAAMLPRLAPISSQPGSNAVNQANGAAQPGSGG